MILEGRLMLEFGIVANKMKENKRKKKIENFVNFLCFGRGIFGCRVFR